MKVFVKIESAFLIFLSAAPNAMGSEFSSKTYSVGVTPAAIAIGDFNGDGKPDLAVANSESNNVSILLNNGDGTFQPAVNYAVGALPRAIAAGDFTGDGKQDLIVVNLGDVDNHVNGNLSLLKGNGDGTFQSPISITAGANPQSIVVSDFNGDKKLDLAVGDARTGILNILLGNGDGTFQSPNSIPLTTFGTVSLTAVDLNADSIVDLVASIPEGAVALLGKGDGTFQAPVHIADTPNSGSFVAAGSVVATDFDGDHKTDIVFQTLHLAPQECRPTCLDRYQLVFYRGNGDGTFQAGVPVSPFFVVAADNIVAADFNGDGKEDVALGFSDIAHIFLGSGSGTFLDLQSIDTSLLVALSLAVGDFNQDGQADLAIVRTGNSISVLLNMSPTSGADLGVTLAASPEPVLATQNLTYTMNVTNTGPQDATNVTLTDALPTSMTFVSATPTQGTCAGTATVTCNFGSMASPSQNSLTLVVTPTQAGSFTDMVTVAATQQDLAPANDAASVTSTVLLPADLVLTKTASVSSIASNSNITYTLTVTNKGPAAATNVVLTDAPSANFSVASATPTQGSCVANSATGNVTCNLGGLAVGVTATATIIVKAMSPATLVNNATVAADQPNLGHNFATVTVLVDPADVAVKETSSATTVTTGTNTTFTATVTNKGPFTASNVQVLDSLPVPTVVSATPSQGSCALPANFNMTCPLGSISAGASATVTVVMAPTAAGPFTNNVNVSADTPDPDTTNNSATVTVTVNLAPDFSLSAASTALAAHPGGSVTDIFTFAALNGFSGMIALTCSINGPPPLPDCALLPSSISAGANPLTSTMTINVPVSAAVFSLQRADWSVRRVYAVTLPLMLLALALGFFRRVRRALWLSCSTAAITLLLCGCGSGNAQPMTKLYTITVTATSNSPSEVIAHTESIALRVQ